jgi:hypothetical protein
MAQDAIVSGFAEIDNPLGLAGRAKPRAWPGIVNRFSLCRKMSKGNADTGPLGLSGNDD